MVLTPLNVIGALPMSPLKFWPALVVVIVSDPSFTEAGFVPHAPGNTRRPTEPVSSITANGAEFPTRISTIPLCPSVPGVSIVRIGTFTFTEAVTAREG